MNWVNNIPRLIIKGSVVKNYGNGFSPEDNGLSPKGNGFSPKGFNDNR